MRDSHLVELRTFSREAEVPVERQRMRLGVQVDPVQLSASGFLDEPSQQHRTHPAPPVGLQHCQAANLTYGFEPPRANCVTVRCPCEGVNADGVRGIPFLALWNLLFLDKYGTPDRYQQLPVQLPGRGSNREWALPDQGAVF